MQENDTPEYNDFSAGNSIEILKDEGLSPKQQSQTTHRRNTTLLAAIFNLTKAAIGTGVLILPYDMKIMGFFPGMLCILLAGFISSSTLYFLGRLSSATDLDSYFALGKLAFGQWGEVSALIALIINLMGALIFYAHLVGIYFSRSLIFVVQRTNMYWWIHPVFWKVATGLLLILPLACMREMKAFAKTSFIGLLGMLYVTILTIVDCLLDRGSYGEIVWFTLDTGFFFGFSTILFAFINHFTIVSLVPVMKNPTSKRRLLLISISTGITTLVYLSVAGFGYFHFRESIKENILISPTMQSWPYAIAQFFVGIVIIMSYPLLCDPARSGIRHVIKIFATDKIKENRFVQSRFWKNFNNILLTFSMVSFSIIIAVSFAEKVLEILGLLNSITSPLLIFIFPSLYFLRLTKLPDGQERYKVKFIERMIAYIDIILGFLTLILGIISSLLQLIK